MHDISGTEEDLSPEELARYNRHIILPAVGVAGQKKLRAARVVLIGAGGLGSPVALYLAAAGVGTLGVVDPDTVDRSNLQRQILHSETTVGLPKTDSARRRLADLNPHTTIEAFATRLSPDNALGIVGGFDLAVDCTDNFASRYLLNETCVALGKAFVYGAVSLFEGQASVFAGRGGPCYRCFFRDPPPEGKIAAGGLGILGMVPGIIGCVQAAETIKLILGLGDSLAGRLLRFDALRMAFRESRVGRWPECPVCGGR